MFEKEQQQQHKLTCVGCRLNIDQCHIPATYIDLACPRRVYMYALCGALLLLRNAEFFTQFPVEIYMYYIIIQNAGFTDLALIG